MFGYYLLFMYIIGIGFSENMFDNYISYVRTSQPVLYVVYSEVTLRYNSWQSCHHITHVGNSCKFMTAVLRPLKSYSTPSKFQQVKCSANFLYIQF